jgi:hypothetical protein
MERFLYEPERFLFMPERFLFMPERFLFMPERFLFMPERFLFMPERFLYEPESFLPALEGSPPPDGEGEIFKSRTFRTSRTTPNQSEHLTTTRYPPRRWKDSRPTPQKPAR